MRIFGLSLSLLGILLLIGVFIHGAVIDAGTPGRFTDITNRAGIHFQHLASHTSQKYLLETMGSGVALFDYDNDGRLDIFFVNGAPLSDPTAPGRIPDKTTAKYWNRLYRQGPNGAFQDVTEKAGLPGIGYGMGVAVGDFDNDGYEDLYVTAYGGNRLYHNNGDGTFSDVTVAAGVAASGWSTSAAWVDLDHDGLLDLVVLRYMQWDFNDVWCGDHRAGYRAYCHPNLFPPASPLVYHNDGNGHFTEVSQTTGISKPGKGLGIAIGDYNRDGYIDIAVANDSMDQFLYRNRGGGKFAEAGLPSGVATDDNGQTYAGMGIDMADFDNDGLPDLVVDNLANQEYALYRNGGDGFFEYATAASGIGRITHLHSGWGLRFLDYDNDGRKDLLVAQGHDLDTVALTYPNLHYREPMLLMRNDGRTFTDVSSVSGDIFHQALAARGLAIGDINNDGRIDAVVTTNDGSAHVLQNDTVTGNHWVTLDLVGHQSNRDGIGAEVSVSTAKGRQYATVTTASSYLSSSDKRVHFGLGRESTILSIEIHWPSGVIQHLNRLACDRLIRIDEPAIVPGSPER